jgi:hypothetical protein
MNHNKFQKFDISLKLGWILAFDHVAYNWNIVESGLKHT